MTLFSKHRKLLTPFLGERLYFPIQELDFCDKWYNLCLN